MGHANLRLPILGALVLATLVGRSATLEADEVPLPCRIDVLDRETGWPVPLVQLRTTHGATFVSDNRGLIAFDLPELMGRETWLAVSGNGYTVPADGFGHRGVRLTPLPGGHLTLLVDRTLPGKRLGRTTGAGLFAESQQLGLETDWQEQGVFGCDSVQTAVHRGHLHWAWGDTVLAGRRLGLFHMIGATTTTTPLDAFVPPIRLQYDYYRDEERNLRVIAPMPGDGPTWLSGYASLPDPSGASRLVATYVKITPPLSPYEAGLCVWDDVTQRFDRHAVLWEKTAEHPEPPPRPRGHANFWSDARGEKWVLFGDPFPTLRCRATFEAWSDPQQWEMLTPQERVASSEGRVLKPHRGSIAWNAYRQKWVAIFTEQGGAASYLGEIWYAEAPEPFGPWGEAIQVATHPNYTFYNPRIHPEWTPDDSPILLFEGTYTAQFANRPQVTPRHNYNQVMYRIDLNEAPFK